MRIGWFTDVPPKVCMLCVPRYWIGKSFQYNVVCYAWRRNKRNVLSIRVEKVDVRDDDIWKIEKILKTKGTGNNKHYFIKWLHWSKKFNSWIYVVCYGIIVCIRYLSLISIGIIYDKNMIYTIFNISVNIDRCGSESHPHECLYNKSMNTLDFNQYTINSGEP
jgi:hypothetical protein